MPALKKHSFYATLAIGLAICLPSMAAQPLPVVASFSILADLVKVVGGERVTVTAMVGPDSDAHVFQPSPQDAVRLSRAKLVVINGLSFEGWLQRLTESAQYRGSVTVASDGVRARQHVHAQDEHDGHDAHDAHDAHAAAQHTHADPHAWQDPRNVITYVANIAAALERIDPAGAAVYRTNAGAYQARLRELDAWAAGRFATIPLARRRVITAHAAFDYLGARYQIRFDALQSLSTDSEPSAGAMAAVVRRMRQDGTVAVFAENLHNARLLRQLAGEAGVTVGPKLYSDALSDVRGPAPTYLALMRYNVAQLVQAMQRP